MFSKRYAITYTSYYSTRQSSHHVGGLTFRTKAGAFARLMQFVRNDTRTDGGEYRVVRVA